MRLSWNVATWNDDGNSTATAPVGLNVSAPVMRGAEYANVHSEGRDTILCNWSNALCEGIRTEIERVCSNDVVIDKKFDLSTEVSYHTDHACDNNGMQACSPPQNDVLGSYSAT